MRCRRVILACGILLVAGLLPAWAEDQYEWKDGEWVKLAPPAKGTAAGELAIVRTLLEQKHYRKTVKAAKKFLKRYGADPARQEVFLLAGQAEMKRGRYYQAFEWFERQLNAFPGGRFAERALKREFEIAEAFLAGKKRIVAKFFRISAKGEALEILTRIAEHAPGTAMAENALLRIADYHYSHSEFPEAVQAYDGYLRLFGKSPRAAYAMLQAARARHASFHGIEHDATPLLDAQQRYLAFWRQYPEQARKAKVPLVLKQITATLAAKLYRTGRFYERTHHLPAAAFYYEKLVNLYPKTQWAADARQALQQLGDVTPARPARKPIPLEAPKNAAATSQGVK